MFNKNCEKSRFFLINGFCLSIIVDMRYGIIDIGSNSVRLLVSEELDRIYKKINTTGLGRGLAVTGELREENMRITANAVEEFYLDAKKEGCGEVYVFATEAVRSAKNRNTFVAMLNGKGIDVDIVESKNEAKLGFFGAYTEGRVCVMDIGGASTELAAGGIKGPEYAVSMPVGLVRIFDNCGEDIQKIHSYVDKIIQGYGVLPQFDEILSIGGTASTYVAIAENMRMYDPAKVDMYKLTKNKVEEITSYIHSLSSEERLHINGLEPKRRDVIVGGGILLSSLMEYLGKDYVIVRESDNQEGYLKYKKGLVRFE